MLLEVTRERKRVGEKVTVSELVAAKIVGSETFEQLLHVIGVEHAKAGLPKTDWLTDPSGFCTRVAKTILGQSISSTVPLLHEIVSGPYDADKLDYMVRDPRAAGIPATIDISRLVQKLSVVRYSSRDLPSTIAKLVPQEIREAYLFGFPWSGLSVIDDLLLGRMMLYAKLYRHPKVAGLEGLVQVLLDQISVLSSPHQVVEFVYNILDDQLVLAEGADLLNKLRLTEADVAAPDKARALEIAVDMLRRLRERELFVRAFAFFPGQPESDDETASGVFDRIIKHIDDQEKRESFRASVVDEARAIMRMLRMKEEDYLYRTADQLIVLRRLNPPSQEELRHAWIFPTGGVPRTAEKSSIHKEAWSSSFVSASAKAYIFAPDELAQIALLATEAVIATQFKVRVPEWMMEETKHSVASLTELKLTLRKGGYYRRKPRIIRPRWRRLGMSDVENVVSQFADQFSAIQETVTEALVPDRSYQGVSALKDRAYRWLDQFDSDEHIDCGLRLLQNAKLIARQDVVGAVRSFVAANPEFAAASVISLSKGNDSSQIVQYFAADLGGDLVFHGSLAEAATAARDAPVIVLDDFVGSGGQWANLIGSLFGDGALKRPGLGEQRLLALRPEQDYLRGRPIGFVFTAGWTAGAEIVRAAAQKTRLDAKVYVQLTDAQLPFADAVLASDDEVAEHASTFLERAGEVGRQLLRKNEPSWSEEKVDERRLGYGNRGMLLFFPYNAPSQTLTCMWAEGDVDGEHWEPIIRRRKKV
jgi:hypothetical protein